MLSINIIFCDWPAEYASPTNSH